MLLAVDVGNTGIKLGVFDGDRIYRTWRWSTDRSRMADEYAAQLAWALSVDDLAPSAIKRTVLCSVVPQVTTTFRQLAERYLGGDVLLVNAAINTGVALEVDNPREVGGDRIANAVAARHLYGTPAIVVDFGTATNFDVISADGAFLGGSFAPGIQTAIDGLMSRAALLQRFDLVAPAHAIGTNTVACLQSGTVFGYVGLVEGLIRRIRQELSGEPRVIGTGGLVDVVAEQTDVFHTVDRELTLHGLRILAGLNPVASAS
jgi:type III pantothenate kinase